MRDVTAFVLGATCGGGLFAIIPPLGPMAALSVRLDGIDEF